MGACGPNIIKKLQGQYGDKLLDWVKAEAGK